MSFLPNWLTRKRPSTKAGRVLEKLAQIESEMKRIGYWHSNPPGFKVHNYLQAPSFELWLQCIFVPIARSAAHEESFPPKSQVGLMALRQYDYHSSIEEAFPLKDLLFEFDKLIESP